MIITVVSWQNFKMRRKQKRVVISLAVAINLPLRARTSHTRSPGKRASRSLRSVVYLGG
jgi:hypothetical protein